MTALIEYTSFELYYKRGYVCGHYMIRLQEVIKQTCFLHVTNIFD